MGIFKINKNDNFTVMSNIHLRDKNMSLKSKGLLSVMLSLPDTWDYSITGLVAICKENNTAIESALKELKELGYLVITKKTPSETESGRFEYEYNIYESPQVEIQGVEIQGVEIQGVEIQGVEIHPQLNTNNKNTNILNTDNTISDRTDYARIVNLYNSICISLSKVSVISQARKKSIKARLNTYTVEQFKEVFIKAEASAFLKGSNNHNWQANFDWLMRDANFAKVLDGNYDGRKSGTNGIAIDESKTDLDDLFKKGD